jgi:LacI family transcriptional regulator
MLQRKVDGVAIMTSEMDENLISEFSSRKIPLVFLDTGTVQKGISNIAIDYAAGVDAAVEHLRALGHEAIAFISGPSDLTSARVRRKAFLASMKRKGLHPAKDLIEEGNHRMDGGHDAMERLLRKTARPTAVLASNDMSAIGAIGAILEHGLKVPGDVSVIGFDDIAMSEYTQPPLTTVRLSRAEIAKLAFHALHEIRNAATAKGEEYKIKPALVERKSTGPIPGKR